MGMLVLTREKDQRIDVGREIVITVVEIRGNKVRLGIEAPSHIEVHRREITEKIKRDGRRKRLDRFPPHA